MQATPTLRVQSARPCGAPLGVQVNNKQPAPSLWWKQQTGRPGCAAVLTPATPCKVFMPTTVARMRHASSGPRPAHAAKTVEKNRAAMRLPSHGASPLTKPGAPDHGSRWALAASGRGFAGQIARLPPFLLAGPISQSWSRPTKPSLPGDEEGGVPRPTPPSRAPRSAASPRRPCPLSGGEWPNHAPTIGGGVMDTPPRRHPLTLGASSPPTVLHAEGGRS